MSACPTCLEAAINALYFLCFYHGNFVFGCLDRLKRIRDLEQKLLTEQETSKKLRLTLQGLKNQNESLLMWKNQEHKKLEDENTVLQRKVRSAEVIFFCPYLSLFSRAVKCSKSPAAEGQRQLSR